MMVMAVAPASAQEVPGYEIVGLGGLGGNATFALDINDRSVVTGNSRTGTTTLPLIGFVWSRRGGMTEVGTLPGSNAFSRGYGINNAGVIVGESDNNTSRAFRWENGQISDLGTLGGATAVALDINTAGQIVGSSSNTLTSRPYLWEAGVMQDLGTVAGGNNTTGRAVSITDAGHIVGSSRVFGTTSQATAWFAPTRGRQRPPISMGSLGDGLQFSEALAVSSQRIAVGRSTVTGSVEHAFRWSPSEGMVDLGTLGFTHSRANDINDRGQIVGHVATFAGSPSFGGAAFMWEDGVMHDLNTLIPAGSGWTLLSAEGINRYGEIVGYGTFGGETRSFLLRPVS